MLIFIISVSRPVLGPSNILDNKILHFDHKLGSHNLSFLKISQRKHICSAWVLYLLWWMLKAAWYQGSPGEIGCSGDTITDT